MKFRCEHKQVFFELYIKIKKENQANNQPQSEDKVKKYFQTLSFYLIIKIKSENKRITKKTRKKYKTNNNVMYGRFSVKKSLICKGINEPVDVVTGSFYIE